MHLNTFSDVLIMCLSCPCDADNYCLKSGDLCLHVVLGLALFQNIGGGWIEAQNSRGEVGLVPEDYIEVRSTVTEFMLVITSHIPPSI